MRTLFIQITLALALSIPLLSHADDNNLTDQFSACIDASGGVTMEMIMCIEAETQRQDARLNKAYQALMANLPPQSERRKQLQDAQRAWIKFRDTNCSFYYDQDGGSVARISAYDRMMTMTADRAKELENLSQL